MSFQASDDSTTEYTPLTSTVGRLGFFALAFGSVVGSAWLVVLGDWLATAGPGGVVVGFVIGCIVMALIALCYGELAARSTAAGGEFLYVLEVLGRGPAFLVAWFLTLYGIAICTFEAIVLSWLLRTLVPSIEANAAYTIAGSPVTWDALAVGWGGALLIGVLHYRGATAAIWFQNLATAGFISVSVVLVICGASLGRLENLQPLFQPESGQSWLTGTVGIYAVCAFFLNGWQTALHAIEERRRNVSVRAAVWSIVGGIIVAALFYCSIVLAAASALPWRQLLGSDLPAVVAFGGLTQSGLLGTVVLVAAMVSIAKAWNAIAWLATRLLFAQARHGFLPAKFVALNRTSRAPQVAILFVTVCSVLGVALGRAAVLPIINMVSTCLGLSVLLCLFVLIRSRRSARRDISFVVPGGTVTITIAIVGALLMIGIAILKPLSDQGGGVPLEWKLLGGWAALGLIVWAAKGRRWKQSDRLLSS